MNNLNGLIDQTLYYLSMSIEFISTHLLTVEGIVALLIVTFVVGLISSVR